MALYDRIGVGYDATRRADPYLTGRLLALLGAEPGAPVLDIACGTGNYTTALARSGLRLCGLDMSSRMLTEARSKAAGVAWLQGSAGALPLRDGAFAGAVCTLAIHHFPALEPCFREARRALGRGRFVLFTATSEQTARFWLTEYFPEAMAASCRQTPGTDAVTESLRAAGFRQIRTESYAVRDDLQDFFLYAGKRRPAMYLDPRVRAGISTFTSLAGPAEVAEGCRRLEQDIATGRIEQIMAASGHDGGDYLFVVAEP